ncbi:MAG: MarR family transcriptional regulator [Ilumatobacteraceae bacterium]|nr:MarR family transcriptional regulator [Ilumatobacteraceae bacterium]
MTARQPRPTEVLEGHIGYLLAKLGALSSSRMDAELAPFGINRMQFGLLKILDAAGPGSQQALSGDLGMPPSRMVALVDDLEDQGFVARERSSSDRRVNEIRLTREGRAVLARANKAAVRWQDELLVDLSAPERNQLVELLRRVTARHLGGGAVHDHS